MRRDVNVNVRGVNRAGWFYTPDKLLSRTRHMLREESADGG